MNEKLLEQLAVESKLLYKYGGMVGLNLLHENIPLFLEQLNQFAELVQANAVTNDEKTHDLHSNGQQIFGLKPLFDSPDADAKLKIAVEALQSAPDGEIRCDASTGHVYGVYWYEHLAPDIGTKVYTAPQSSDAEAKLKVLVEFLRIHANSSYATYDYSGNELNNLGKQALEKIGE